MGRANAVRICCKSRTVTMAALAIGGIRLVRATAIAPGVPSEEQQLGETCQQKGQQLRSPLASPHAARSISAQAQEEK